MPASIYFWLELHTNTPTWRTCFGSSTYQKTEFRVFLSYFVTLETYWHIENHTNHCSFPVNFSLSVFAKNWRFWRDFTIIIKFIAPTALRYFMANFAIASTTPSSRSQYLCQLCVKVNLIYRTVYFEITSIKWVKLSKQNNVQQHILIQWFSA